MNQYFQQFSTAERARFSKLLASAPSPVHAEAIWKGLAAAHPLPELEAFAGQIRDYLPEELTVTLNLRDLTQSHRASCEVSVAQVIRGERDKLYSLAVRLANPDIHRVQDGNPLATNWVQGNEQQAWLEKYGGKGSPRGSRDGKSIWATRSPELWSDFADRIGVFFEHKVESSDITLGGLVDALAEQVGVDSPPGVEGGSHAVAALSVSGSGAGQVFEIYEPWRGVVVPVTRQQILDRAMPLSPWAELKTYRVAVEIDAPAPFSDEVLPALRDLPPPPPPVREVVAGTRGMVRQIKPLAARNEAGAFVQWIYPLQEYDWRGVEKMNSRFYVDVDGHRVTREGAPLEGPKAW